MPKQTCASSADRSHRLTAERLEERLVFSVSVASRPDPNAFNLVANTVETLSRPALIQLANTGRVGTSLTWDQSLEAIWANASSFALTGAVTGVVQPLSVPIPTASLEFTSFKDGNWWFDVPVSGRPAFEQVSNLAAVFPDQFASFGIGIDVAAPGDWNNVGFDQLGVFRADQPNVEAKWFLDTNRVRGWQWNDTVVSFGQLGDRPVVGDWNRDGKDDIGVYRNGVWYLDFNGNRRWDAGDRTVSFGVATDTPVVGDWNGDGRDDIGVVRGKEWFLDTNGTLGYQGSDRRVLLPIDQGRPVVGDWNGDGRDDIGRYWNRAWYLDPGIVFRQRSELFVIRHDMGPDDQQVFVTMGKGVSLYDVARRVSLFPPYGLGQVEFPIIGVAEPIRSPVVITTSSVVPSANPVVRLNGGVVGQGTNLKPASSKPAVADGGMVTTGPKKRVSSTEGVSANVATSLDDLLRQRNASPSFATRTIDEVFTNWGTVWAGPIGNNAIGEVSP